MNRLNIDDLNVIDDLWVLNSDRVGIGFSNAEGNRSFNRHTEDGINNLLNIKEQFEAEEIVYLRQVHSDKVFIYKNNKEQFVENEGDAIITDVQNVIIGAFTADCVPVILVDSNKKVISAIHSGWKGTFNHICSNAVSKMINEFGCESENIKAYIGPHIRQCCYEVSEELKERFLKEFNNLDSSSLFKGRNLNMELCIESDLVKSGVENNNIYSLGLCTHCDEEHKLFSYRASSGTYGRLFSFCYIK